MGIDAKNRLLKKAGTVDPEDAKLAGEPKGNGIKHRKKMKSNP